MHTKSGPMRIGDDWCGVFIRGDDAFGYAWMLEDILNKTPDSLRKAELQTLVDLLFSCREPIENQKEVKVELQRL